MKARSTYQIMQDMRAAEQAREDIAKGKDVHPDALARVFEMQRERVPCLFCGTVTKTDVHVEYTGGISVWTKYVCPKCTHEFMEKDIPR
jgi:transposase-like protein